MRCSGEVGASGLRRREVDDICCENSTWLSSREHTATALKSLVSFYSVLHPYLRHRPASRHADPAIAGFREAQSKQIEGHASAHRVSLTIALR